MRSIEMAQALWRPVTGAVMSLVVLAVALGWLPAEAEAHADSLLTAAGAVLSTLAASRAFQRVHEVRGGTPANVADEVVARIRAMVEQVDPAHDVLGAASLVPHDAVVIPQKPLRPGAG